MLESFAPMLWIMAGGIVLAVLLPFVASFLLDGLLALSRGRGVVPLLGAMGFVVGVAAIGVVFWALGVAASGGQSGTEQFAVAMEQNMRMLLAFSIPLALFAFIIRWVRAARR